MRFRVFFLSTRGCKLHHRKVGIQVRDTILVRLENKNEEFERAFNLRVAFIHTCLAICIDALT